MRSSFLPAILCVAACTAMLLWPAFVNGYPLMFGDTGVYVFDGVHRHASWPRPMFYGLFMLPLHLKLTVWPVVVVQALISALLIRAVVSRFLQARSEGLQLGIVAILAATTSLPWFASQIMPDVFGPMIVLALAWLVLTPERMGVFAQVVLVLLIAGLITFHQSYVPIAAAAAVILLLGRWWVARRLRLPELLRAFAPPALAVMTLIGYNAVFAGRASLSPYGAIFPMARMMIEGPGQRTLERECPRADWSMCSQIGKIPATAEEFLFGEDGTVARAGGYKEVAAQAPAIVAATLKAEPQVVIEGAIRRVVEQFGAFATGDWLDKPMPSVIQIWHETFPPAEVARLEAGRQVRGFELVSDELQLLHRTVGFASLALLVVGAAAGLWRRSRLGVLLATFIVVLVVNAAVTGGLSGVYDRYQSRFVWLAVLGSMMLIVSLRQPAPLGVPAGSRAR